MEVMTWGDLTLKVDGGTICTFSDFEWTIGYTSSTKEQKKKKPKTTAKAPNLEQISFSVIMLKAMGVDVEAQIDAWKSACNAGDSNELSIGGKRIGDEGSTWRIKSLKVGDVQYGSSAEMIGAKLSISMDEVAGKAKKSGSGSRKKRGSSKKVRTSGSGGSSSTKKYQSSRSSNPEAHKRGMRRIGMTFK